MLHSLLLAAEGATWSQQLKVRKAGSQPSHTFLFALSKEGAKK